MESVPDRTITMNPALERTLLVTMVSLGMGLLFDLLFFEKLPGLSFPVYIVATLAVLLLWAHLQRRKVPRTARLIIPPLLFFAAMVFVRAGELLTFFNVVLSFYLLLLFVNLVFAPKLPLYKFKDYFALLFGVPLRTLSKAREGLSSAFKRNSFISKHQAFPQVVRGVLIALPVLLLFAILFSSADLVFRDFITGVFSFDVNAELIFRTFWILAVAVVFFGLFGLFERKEDPAQHHQEQPAKASRGGLVEASIMLGSLNGLFLIFIFVQLAYLFGGAANVVGGEFTYAEYARKGFFELVVVAALSFVLIFVTEHLLKKDGQKHSLQFKVLSGALIVQVLIVMLSALKRLQLYEGAYGYTSARLYAHVFIIWLAVIFVALMYKILADKRENFLAFTMFIGVMALFLAFNSINVDGLAARKNIDRYEATGKLDVRYINTLSDDAVVEMTGLLDSKDVKLRDAVARDLYLRRNVLLEKDSGWQSANITRTAALNALNQNRELLDQSKDKTVDPSYIGPGH